MARLLVKLVLLVDTEVARTHLVSSGLELALVHLLRGIHLLAYHAEMMVIDCVITRRDSNLIVFGNLIRSFVVHMVHPPVPLWLYHGGIGVLDVRVLDPSVLTKWQIQILVVFISKFIRPLQLAEF